MSAEVIYLPVDVDEFDLCKQKLILKWTRIMRQVYKQRITLENCRENALRFTPERFIKEFREFVDKNLILFRERKIGI